MSNQSVDILNKNTFFGNQDEQDFKNNFKKEKTPVYLDYSWQVYRVVSLTIILLLIFGFKILELYLKDMGFDDDLLSIYKVFAFFALLNIIVYLFLLTYNRYRSTIRGPKGTNGVRGKRGNQGESNNCDICTPKLATFKKQNKYVPKKEYIENVDTVVDVSEIGTKGWKQLDSIRTTPGETQPVGSNFIPVLDNTSIGVNCNKNDDTCETSEQYSKDGKPIIGVAANFDKYNNNITSLQYFVDKNMKHSERVYKPQLLGKRRFGNLKNKGAKLNFMCPPNSAIYKVDSVTSNKNIKGLKFYCQDIETGKNTQLLDSNNSKVDGFTLGKEPKEDDKFYYYKSVQCNSIKDKYDDDKYYPTFISNVSGSFNDTTVKNLSFNKCSYFKK
jgi:hypothetical protein